MRRLPALLRPGLIALTLTAASSTAAVASTAEPPLTGPTAGSIGLRLVDAPANAAGDPRAQLYIVDRVAPGSAIHRQIEVSNTASSPTRTVLYAAAADVVNGAFVGAAGHAANEVSTWTSVTPSVASVPAAGRVSAAVTIDVPIDAAPGERYGAVWAEVRSAPAAGGIAQVNRVGIRIYLSVGPGAAPAANFSVDSLTAGRLPKGDPTVSASVHNTGGRALDISGNLQLSSGPAGMSAGPYPVTLGTTIAIGGTDKVWIILDRQLPAGPWSALLTLRSGLLERRARATIVFPVAGKAPAVGVVRGTPSRWWVLPALALAMLILFWLLIVAMRRRRDSRDQQPPPVPRRPHRVGQLLRVHHHHGPWSSHTGMP